MGAALWQHGAAHQLGRGDNNGYPAGECQGSEAGIVAGIAGGSLRKFHPFQRSNGDLGDFWESLHCSGCVFVGLQRFDGRNQCCAPFSGSFDQSNF